MITWIEFRDRCLADADATAKVAAHLTLLAKEMREGNDPWKYADFIDEAMGDDPPISALLRRNMLANELLAAAMKDLRAAIIAADAERRAAMP